MKKLFFALCTVFVMTLTSCSDKDELPEIVKIPEDMAKAFPDPIFRSYVLKNFDIDNNGVISKEEAEIVTIINVSNFGTPKSEKIKSLQGIEYFTALRSLSCGDNQLTTLDVSGCTALEELDCFNNQLTTLDVSGCTALEELYCFNNQLTTLDVSGCTALRSLSCGDNQLTSLDVSGCTALLWLSCQGNKLTTLDVSKTNLGKNSELAIPLICSMSSLTKLILKKGWKIKFITPDRDSYCINANTQIEFVD